MNDVRERASRFLRQCSPHHREREWYRLLEEFLNQHASEINAREWQQTLLDVTNALADRITNTDSYAPIVAQARKLLRATADMVDASESEAMRHDLERSVANHVADLNDKSETKAIPRLTDGDECGRRCSTWPHDSETVTASAISNWTAAARPAS